MSFSETSTLFFSIVLTLLLIASTVGWVLHHQKRSEAGRLFVENFNARTKSWWLMVAVLLMAYLFGPFGATLLFFICSGYTFIEFNSPRTFSRAAALFFRFGLYLFTPLQYGMLALHAPYWNLFPMTAFFIIGLLFLLLNRTSSFLIEISYIFFGFTLCIFSLSHAPALILFIHQLPDAPFPAIEQGMLLLAFLMFIAQFNDVLQYVFGKTRGKTLLAPKISPSKTVEGVLWSMVLSCFIAASLWWLTPFKPVYTAIMGLIIVFGATLGGLLLSWVKRRLLIKDWGSFISGHGGLLDRLDSLVLTAPLFYYVVVALQ